LNANNKAYLRGLAKEFGESTNKVRLELNKLEDAGILCSEYEGNKKYFCANKQHPLFTDIHNIVLKYAGVDRIIEEIVKHVGEVNKVYLTGDWAIGKESDVIDLCIVGANLNKHYLLELIGKIESLIDKRIKYLIYQNDMNIKDAVLLWADDSNEKSSTFNTI